VRPLPVAHRSRPVAQTSMAPAMRSRSDDLTVTSRSPMKSDTAYSGWPADADATGKVDASCQWEPSWPASRLATVRQMRTNALLSARFPLLFIGMRTVSRESVAGAARHHVAEVEPGTFLQRRDFDGGDRAVESALSRLAAEGELLRVRKGLYWRGKRTRFGMTRPSPFEVALAVAGLGAGPSGVAAAQMLGLTTQVPATVEVAVPGTVPDPIPGIRFRSRPYSRRERRLTPIEVAVLEVLRDPAAIEVSWPQAEARIRELVEDGLVRSGAVGEAAAAEPRVNARERWVAVGV